MNPEEIVASTSDPAFAVGGNGPIVAWNQAVESMLGRHASEVLGRSCWEVLGGLDVFGNTYCHEGCPLLAMARRHVAVGHSELFFLTADENRIRVAVNTMVVPAHGTRDLTVIHLLSHAIGPPEECRPTALENCRGEARRRLTDRETEILQLLAAGEGTLEIARLLFISPSTTRNHIQHILQKLRAHTRLEAVSIARRLGLIEHEGG